jgi:O-antigen/teichoic acid export membrane protein
MRFKAFSLYAASMGLVRLVIPLILVFMGYKVGGAYFGLALGTLLSFLIGFLMLKKDLVRGSKRDLSEEYKKVISLALPVLLLNLGMISLNNIDVILVKKYFDAATAGYYAGVVILGKVILFGVGSITIVMFPQISALASSGRDYMNRLKFFLKLLLTVLSGAVLVFSLMPSLIARILFGEQLLASAQYLPMFSIFISMYVLVNFLLMFFVAINRTKTSLILIPAVILQFVAINLFHGSIFTIIGINTSITFLLLATLGIYLYKISSKTAH